MEDARNGVKKLM